MARGPRSTLGSALALAPVIVVAVQCQTTPPPNAGGVRAIASASAAPSTSAALDVDAGPPDPLAAIKARGAIHGDPIKIPAAGKYGDRWLVFVGTPDIARAAWVVSPGAQKDELTPVEGWPAGVKVVASHVKASVVYLILETVAMLDQPAGLRAVWFDGFGNASPFTFAPQSAFAGVRDAAELEKRVEAGPSPIKKPPDGALMAALRTASASEATLGKALSTSGADVSDVWQDMFAHAAEHLDPQKLSASSHAQELLAVVKDAVKNDHCEINVCETPTAKGHASIVFGEEAGRWVIRAFELEAAPPRAATSAPKLVPASAMTTITEQALREHVRETRQILGEAPLGARGTIGVALTDYESNGPTMIIKDGDYARVFPLSAMSFVGANASDARYEVRFADVDGDGRTDVVLRATGTANDATPLAYAQVFLAPPASVQATDALVDHGSDLALLGVASADAAAQALLSVPTRGVAVADACKLLTGANNVASFRRVSTADVRVLTFEEPSMPTYRARVVPEPRLRTEDVRDVGRRCKDLECAPTRPYCTYTDGPYSEWYWFAWDANAMRLAGVAFYTGS